MVPSHRLVTQSTYSLSWKAVSEVGYWDVDVIPEDSHMCFKVLFHFGQRVKVRPIFLPVYADAAEGATLRRTLENQYHQILRWAWGVSDIPYVVYRRVRRARPGAGALRIMRVVWYVEEHLMWPSHWFLLTLGGLVPRLVNPTYAHSAARHVAVEPGLGDSRALPAVPDPGHPGRLAAAAASTRTARTRSTC